MSGAANKIDAIQSRTFAVDDVVPADQPIWTESLSEHVAKRLKRTIIAIPGPERPIVNTSYAARLAWNASPEFAQRREKLRSFGGDTQPLSLEGAISRSHPLIDAVGTAFAQHRPLTLSPDSIWLVIEQGFSHHLLENAEALRSRLVRHEGKEGLFAAVPDLSLESFESAVQQFSTQIRDRTNQVLHETLICNFSTTTPEIRTASEVVLMDCFSAYFEYFMGFVCGIPKVTLTGTIDDWRSIRERVEVFAAYDLDWWLPRLRVILDELVRTVEGNPSIAFWQGIYKPKKVYGGTAVTGWIGDLFPYLNDAPQRKRNHVLNFERAAWGVPVKNGVESLREPGVSTDSFPSGLSSVPVSVLLPANLPYTLSPASPLSITPPRTTGSKVDFFGGFFGVQQDPADLALSPMIGWAVAAPESTPAAPVRQRRRFR